MSRRKVAAAVIAAVMLSSIIGWVAGRRIQSPADLAARTAAPPASPILVPVESRVLSSEVVTRGTARFGSSQQVILAASALKPGPGRIDTLPAIGAELKEGDVAFVASGRPVLVVQGSQPSYRDLGPGLEGSDVRQLEEALARLGFDPGPVDGVYDESTGAAVAAWYRANGFEAAQATESQLAAIRTLENELTTARLDLLKADQSVVSAQIALASAQSAQRAAQLDAQNTTAAITLAEGDATQGNNAAAADVALKQAALDRARSQTLAAAVIDLHNAQANADAVRLAGERAVADARAVLEQAPARLVLVTAGANVTNQAADADVTATQAIYDDLTTHGGSASAITVAHSELQNALANAQSVHAANEAAVADAQAIVDGAPAALASAQREADSANRAAQTDVVARQAALDSARGGQSTQTLPVDVAVAAADLHVAQANLATVRMAGEHLMFDARAKAAVASSSVDGANTAVTLSQGALDLAHQEAAARIVPRDVDALNLGLARRRAGVQVPADEVVFLPSAPVRVAELVLKRSDPATGAVVRVTDTSVAVDGSLALAEASLVKAGMTVDIKEPDLGISATGVVQSIAATPGTNGVDAYHIYFATHVDNPPSNLVGASVRLTIAVESTGGAALVVPVNAVSLGPDGSSRVERDNHGTLETVTVEPGLSAAGLVAVRPMNGSLARGDLVEVGVDAKSTTNAASTSSSTPGG